MRNYNFKNWLKKLLIKIGCIGWNHFIMMYKNNKYQKNNGDNSYKIKNNKCEL